MPLRPQRPVGRSLHEKLVRAYAYEAARLRELAAGATTARVRLRLLDEAENQERLAQAARRGIIQTMRHPNGELRMPTFPVRFDGAPAPVTPAPLLGEHTAEVFGEWLGMSADDVAMLRAEGVV